MSLEKITSYSVIDLLSWQESGALSISPKFQRRSVWPTGARGHFIDSILLDYPIPPIHIRLVNDKSKRAVREVIDGQQRIRAVFDFISGRYKIPPSVTEHWGGKGYKQLTDKERDRINLFSFTVYQYTRLSDQEVLEIFARLNTYSVRLNAQELRNGRWFGDFKRMSYKLGTSALEFWRMHRVFTESQISRMSEAELTSELLIAELDGMQDKKKSIDSFYENLDLNWAEPNLQWPSGKGPQQRLVPAHYLTARAAAKRFEATIATIDRVFGNTLEHTPLRRPALFYTLFCAVYHMSYGLPRNDDAILRRLGMTASTKRALHHAALTLQDVFDSKGQTNDDVLNRFYEASARQTDNIGPRQDRFLALLDLVSRDLKA